MPPDRQWEPQVNVVRVHRFLCQGLAALADPLFADVTVLEELSRNDVQALAHVFADTHYRLVAAARRVLGLMVVLDPFEVLRQGLALWLTSGGGLWRVARFFGGRLQRCQLGFEIRLVGRLVDVNYPDRSATTILAGGSGE